MFIKGSKALYFAFILFLSTPLPAQTNLFPVISELSSTNILFKQFSQEIENSYKKIARTVEPVDLLFFKYTAKPSDTLITIAARCVLPYETLATLNRINSSNALIAGMTLLLPTCPGLFLPSDPKTPLEILLTQKYLADAEYSCYTLDNIKYSFVQNARLSSTERAFFLDSALQLPLPNGILTSDYGMRKSPITGHYIFHDGVDFAAPEGTPVLACKAGSVEKTGWSEVYGNFIIIKHDASTRSFYAHLSTISVTAGDLVFSHGSIGKVGSTGLSTGAHLHFEIWIDGKTVDPLSMIKG